MKKCTKMIKLNCKNERKIKICCGKNDNMIILNCNKENTIMGQHGFALSGYTLTHAFQTKLQLGLFCKTEKE